MLRDEWERQKKSYAENAKKLPSLQTVASIIVPRYKPEFFKPQQNVTT
jgi:hypothetical protein